MNTGGTGKLNFQSERIIFFFVMCGGTQHWEKINTVKKNKILKQVSLSFKFYVSPLNQWTIKNYSPPPG